jgi:hypothetical protein
MYIIDMFTSLILIMNNINLTGMIFKTFRNRNVSLLIFLLFIFLSSCKKRIDQTPSIETEIGSVANGQPCSSRLITALSTECTATDFSSLSIENALFFSVDSGRMRILKIPMISKNPETDFILISSDANESAFKGSIIHIEATSNWKNGDKFSGSIIVNSLDRLHQEIIDVRDNFRVNYLPNAIVVVPSNPSNTVSLPEVIVTASYPTGGGISYNLWMNLLSWIGVTPGDGIGAGVSGAESGGWFGPILALQGGINIGGGGAIGGSNILPPPCNTIAAPALSLDDIIWQNINNTNAGLIPFTTTDLKNLCENRGWGTGVPQVVFNRKAGKAFEETALNYFGLKENTINYDSPIRASMNAPNLPTKVRPDCRDNLIFYYKDGGGTHINQLHGWVNVEVKAVRGTIELSYNQYQILGELDILNKAKQASQAYLPYDLTKYRPLLIFITTDDTQIGETVKARAQQMNIDIWQIKSRFDLANAHINFTQPRWVGGADDGYYVPPSIIGAILQGEGIAMVPANLVGSPRPNFTLDPEELDW